MLHNLSAVWAAFILLGLTARYALEISPSKCCSNKGFFPWTLCLLYVVALFTTILSFWWRFPSPLYDFDGAFCHHFLCSNFIVILFRFQISKNGGAKWSHFWIPGALSAPHSRYVAKIQFRFTIHTNWKLSYRLYYFLYIFFSW